MHTVEQAYRSASEFYWIAFLLTGHGELSLQVTLNALNLEDGLWTASSPASPAVLRQRVIQNALAATQAEITASAKRFAQQQSDQWFMATTASAVDSGRSKAQIEAALLAIDVFPRCALLLTVFEGLPLEEVRVLLQCDRASIVAGRITALRELARNLADSNRSTTSAEQEIRRVTTEMRQPNL